MPVKAQELWTSLGAPASVRTARFDDFSEIDPTGWRLLDLDAMLRAMEWKIRMRSRIKRRKPGELIFQWYCLSNETLLVRQLPPN